LSKNLMAKIWLFWLKICIVSLYKNLIRNIYFQEKHSFWRKLVTSVKNIDRLNPNISHGVVWCRVTPLKKAFTSISGYMIVVSHRVILTIPCNTVRIDPSFGRIASNNKTRHKILFCVNGP
jgi:hypothetical protein